MGMRSYRKIPVVVQALQVTDEYLDAVDADEIDGIKRDAGARQAEVMITGSGGHGYLTAGVGDWIIRGVEGELYPCTDSVFQKTHEGVE